MDAPISIAQWISKKICSCYDIEFMFNIYYIKERYDIN